MLSYNFQYTDPCGQTDLNIVMDVDTLHHIHVKTCTLDACSHFLNLFHCPDLSRLLVVKCQTSPPTPGICRIISGVISSFPSPYQRNVICIPTPPSAMQTLPAVPPLRVPSVPYFWHPAEWLLHTERICYYRHNVFLLRPQW